MIYCSHLALEEYGPGNHAMKWPKDVLRFIVFSMRIKKRQTWAWRQSLRGVLSRKRQAETDAHVHSSDSNKEPIVGSTCLRKSPVCSWLGGSVAKSLCITPTASLCPLPLCHVHLLSSPLDYQGGFISMQWVCFKGMRYRTQTKWVVLVFTGLKALMSWVSNFTIQETFTGSFTESVRPPLFPPLVPASCSGQAPSHQRLLLAALKKLSRDLITPLQAVSCMQPATHTQPKQSFVSVAHQIQLSYHSIWYLTTVMLVNRVSLMSHRCDIFFCL